METKDISGQSLITASFILADETASARARLYNSNWTWKDIECLNFDS